MAKDDKKKLITSQYHVEVTRTRHFEEETEGAAFGKDKPEKVIKNTSDTDKILDVIVEDIDVQDLVKLLFNINNKTK